MIADTWCLDCEEHQFSLQDAAGRTLLDRGDKDNLRRGRYWFPVKCPVCERTQAFVVRELSQPRFCVLWPCSWNDEPCQESDCGYCEGEYV